MSLFEQFLDVKENYSEHIEFLREEVNRLKDDPDKKEEYWTRYGQFFEAIHIETLLFRTTEEGWE